jgi:hypothetical protein
MAEHARPHPPRGTPVDSGRRRPLARAGRARVHSLSQAGRHPRARQSHGSASGTVRGCLCPRRHSWLGRFGGRSHRRIHAARARRRPRGHLLARRAALVKWLGRHARNLLGRFHRTASRGPGASRAQGDHAGVLLGQPVHGRCPLPRRLAMQREFLLGHHVSDGHDFAAGSANSRRTLAGDVACPPASRAAYLEPMELSPALRRALAERLRRRRLQPHPRCMRSAV